MEQLVERGQQLLPNNANRLTIDHPAGISYSIESFMMKSIY